MFGKIFKGLNIADWGITAKRMRNVAAEVLGGTTGRSKKKETWLWNTNVQKATK